MNRKHLSRETKSLSYPIFIFGLIGLLFFFDIRTGETNTGGIFLQNRVDLPIVVAQKPKTPQLRPGSSRPPSLNAKAVLVKDASSKTLIFEKNSEEILPIASLTKLMTALVATARVSPEEMVEVRAEDTNVAPNKSNLTSGEKVLVKDLLSAMLVASANDAALAVARHAGGTIENFVGFMNQEAERLGMRQTSFQNPVGFDDPKHFSTADDLSMLVEEFMKHSDLMNIVGLRETKFTSVDGDHAHLLATTNKLLSQPQVLGIKTGYTNEAKGNIIILTDPSAEHPDLGEYYLIILGSSTREADAQKLMDWVEQNFVWTR